MRKSLLLLSSGRRVSIEALIAFCAFTGIMRGLLEGLFFDPAAIGVNLIISYIPFYLMMFLGILAVLRFFGGLSDAQVFRTPLAALFLGMFPPLLDALISGVPNPSIRYGYYMELFEPQAIPTGFYLFHMPQHRLPAGEAIVVWLTILLAGTYARLQGARWYRAGLVSLGVYGLFLFHSYFLPSVLRYWMDHSHGNMFSFDLNLVLPLAQFFVAFVIFHILRMHSVRYQLIRLLHIAPFIMVYLIGSANTGIHIALRVHIAACLYFLFLTLIIQNDWFDRRDDQLQNRRVHFNESDLIFFTANMLVILVFLGVFGSLVSLYGFIILVCGVLYSFPFYRGKGRLFPTMKFEGLWGVMSFLSGALPFPGMPVTQDLLIRCALVFGGWSVFSLLKDVKDIRADYQSGKNSVYIWFYRRSWHLRTAHRMLVLLCSFLLLIPVIFVILKGEFVAAAGLLVLAVMFAVLGIFLPLRIRYPGILLSLIAYLAAHLFFAARLAIIQANP